MGAGDNVSDLATAATKLSLGQVEAEDVSKRADSTQEASQSPAANAIASSTNSQHTLGALSATTATQSTTTNPSSDEASSTTASAFSYPPSLAHCNVTAEAYLAAHSETQILATGVRVFARSSRASDHGRDHLLLVQRSNEDSFPGCWEIPGGGVDLNGETILEAAARELREETGLVVEEFVGDTSVVRFSTGSGEGKRWWEKFAFEARVTGNGRAGGDGTRDGEGVAADEMDDVSARIRLDPKEHQAWIWASEDEVRDGRVGEMKLQFMTAEQQQIMLVAFARRRRAREDADGSGAA